MSTFDREWFLEVRKNLDHANCLKSARPQDTVRAVAKLPDCGAVPLSPFEAARGVSAREFYEMPCDVNPFEAPEDGA